MMDTCCGIIMIAMMNVKAASLSLNWYTVRPYAVAVANSNEQAVTMMDTNKLFLKPDMMSKSVLLITAFTFLNSSLPGISVKPLWIWELVRLAFTKVSQNGSKLMIESNTQMTKITIFLTLP
jgi:hypothetical protein